MSLSIQGSGAQDAAQSRMAQKAASDAFSNQLKDAHLDVSRFIAPPEESFGAEMNPKKRKTEAIEAVHDAETGDDEPNVYQTVHELSDKLKALAELERRSAGL